MSSLFARARVPFVVEKLFFAVAFVAGMVLVGDAALAAGDAKSSTVKTQATVSKSTGDHTKYEQLQRDFKSGPEVTAACLECHTEASKQIHKTTHWTWSFKNPVTGQQLGKKNVINNLCIATADNLPRCTSCHVGYGWKDDSFDFASEKNVDCLICHDTTGTYKKFPVGAGHPAYTDKKFMGKPFKAVDLPKVAQNVGATSRKTCGTCHFMSGGGDAVKHGDLDSTMFNPDRSLDVHMDAKGLNFSCSTCHATGGHDVAGSRYATKAVDKLGIDVPGHTDDSRATCESCHGLMPHPETNHPKLNDHTDKVACTTCHVPEFARGGKKTKMWWDWSTAGKMKEKGKFLVKKNEAGDVVYHTLKGSFEWEGNVVPDYRWYDGRIEYTMIGEKIDDTDVVNINSISGKYGDPDARIWPFKVMRGKQPYDKKNKILALPHLFGKDKNAYWGNFDWNKAIATGMQSRDNMEYSGEYDFVETRYYWPILHMVAPKEDAVACNQCHTTENGRLAALSGFYMPGRDSYPWLSKLGWVAAALTLLGVIIHMLVRIVMNGRRR